jgi:hypothetical protein
VPYLAQWGAPHSAQVLALPAHLHEWRSALSVLDGDQTGLPQLLKSAPFRSLTDALPFQSSIAEWYLLAESRSVEEVQRYPVH